MKMMFPTGVVLLASKSYQGPFSKKKKKKGQPQYQSTLEKHTAWMFGSDCGFSISTGLQFSNINVSKLVSIKERERTWWVNFASMCSFCEGEKLKRMH